MPMVDVSVIVVNHNTKGLCAQAIAAVHAATHLASYEVIVIDNSTREQERIQDVGEMAAHVAARSAGDVSYACGCITLLHVNNHGFGHACNAGATKARGRYLLFLNPDTAIDDGAIDRSVEHMDADVGIGALGIKTALADGSIDHASKRGFPTPFNALCHLLGIDRLFPRCKLFGGYRLAYLDPNKTIDVDAVSGSFILARNQLFSSLGGFDEEYFMYGEDIDLCWRIKGAGYRVVYFAGASMCHLKGQSGLHTDDPVVRGRFYESMGIFYDKRLRHAYGPLMAFAVHVGIRVCRRFALSRRSPAT